MNTIRNDSAFEEIKRRLAVVSTDSTRQWGRMNLQQMLVHCTQQLKLALGEVPARQQGSFIMRSALSKWIAFSDIPWPKGTNTPNEMNVEKNSFSLKDVDTEKQELLSYLAKVRQQNHLQPHPFFGKLSLKEWSKLIYKHLDHHLKQFNS